MSRASDPNKFGTEVLMFNEEEMLFGENSHRKQDLVLSEIDEEGEYEFKNGSIYHGQWKENQRHGYGI